MRFQFNPFTDKLDISGLGPGVTSVDFLTGNSGGTVAADASFNINVIGDNTSGINTVGNGSPNTLTIFGLASTTTQIGTTRYATNAEAAAQTIGTAALTPSNITSLFSTNFLPSSQGGTGLSSPAAHQLIVTNGSSAYTPLGVGSNGQIPIGSIASNPVLNTITAGSGVSVTNGPGTITIGLTGTGAIETLTGNSGGAISPTANNINTLGTGSITIAGAGSTLTTQLTGLTNHAIQIGAGTATLTQLATTATAGQVLQSGGAAADPAYSTATYPLTTVVSQILYSSSTNTVSGLATANRAVLTTGTTGIPVLTALAVDGQLIIGSTAGSPAASTLTAGTGISITNASNSITIAVTGSGFTWTDVTGATQTLSVENGYISDRGGGVTFTLPATASLGDGILIVGKLGLWTIAQNALQQIVVGSASSTIGVTGSVASTNVGDCVSLIAIVSGTSTVWRANSFVGNLTVT